MQIPDNCIAYTDRLSFSYRNDNGRELSVFDDFCLKINKNYSTICLTGPDGSGKSTLLKLLCGVLKPKKGEVYLNSHKADNSNCDFVKMQSYMSQTLGLYQELSVLDNLKIFSSLKGVDTQKEKNFLFELLEKVDLLRFKDRLSGDLSGGMKQKLAITCAIAPKPKILVLDEPTVGIDPLSRREIWDIISEYLKSNNASCIFSSAYLEEAYEADYTIMLKKGKILMHGEPKKLTDAVKDQTFSLCAKDKDAKSLCREFLSSTIRFDKNSLIADICPKGGKLNLISTKKTDAETVLAELYRHSLHGNKRYAKESENTKAITSVWADNFTLSKRPPTLEDLYIIESLKDFKSETTGQAGKANPPQKEDGTAIICVHDIKKKFGDFTAVDHSSFEVHKGEIFGLLGPNGAGKTTTFRMLCALLTPTEGSIRINGYDLAKAKADVRASIGYVSQKFSLYRNMTVKQNLEYFGHSYSLYAKSLKNRINELLSEFSLRDYADTLSAELPFGLQRQLSMACALIHKPRILFLDEATSGADPLARRLFWDRVNLLAQDGTSVIVTTHFMDEAEYCDHFLIQDSGKILILGTPDDICMVNGQRLSIEERFLNLVKEHRRAIDEPG